MKTWKITVSCVLVGLFVAAASGGVLAQDPGESPGEQPGDTGAMITKFAEVPWGAGETTVREKHGEPWGDTVMDTSHPGGPWRVLLYHKKVFDKKATLLFGLRGDTGLVHGYVWLTGFEAEQCDTTYEDVVDLLQKDFSTLQVETSRYNRSPYLDFCKAVRVDQAGRSTRWVDPVNGVNIELTINDHASLTIHFFTPEYARFRGEETGS